ncbi:methanogen output domain 1-containing protein [Streptomyces sp. NPDC005492]|uniref:methanogen output domain 1-containing protein n=1 Tax=Streptomyces sp. NPDC005492 TaxID=3156883 RepID=UPI0033B97B98
MEQVSDVEIPLDRDVFLRTLVRELATSLESVIGLEEASGYVSLVGAGRRHADRGPESMCMMTANVFGTVAARNLGYAQVDPEESIARGDAGCRVVVRLVFDVDVEAVSGREYFGDRAVAP